MMTNAQLATASLDDIVFDGRNRSYGAYELRALYQRHVARALVIAAAVCALLLGFPLVAQLLRGRLPAAPSRIIVDSVLLAPPIDPAVIVPPLAVPPVAPPVQRGGHVADESAFLVGAHIDQHGFASLHQLPCILRADDARIRQALGLRLGAREMEYFVKGRRAVRGAGIENQFCSSHLSTSLFVVKNQHESTVANLCCSENKLKRVWKAEKRI